MNAEILCIGTELLHGDITNTNARYISKELAKIGIDVHYQTVVGDNPQRMREGLNLAFSRADVVITTGGLGPTQDDITKYAVADFFGVNMVYDAASEQHIKNCFARFAKKNGKIREMTENNMRQAYFPEGADILDNPNGTANACIFNARKASPEKCVRENNIVISLPGPPREMSPLVDNEVIPYLKEYSDYIVKNKKIVVFRLGESRAETLIMDLMKNQTNPTIAPYAGDGKVVFRVTAKAKTEKECFDLINPVADELLRRFEGDAFVMKNEDLQETIIRQLLEKNVTIATAESLTGGMIASSIVKIPGVSKIFNQGYVIYSNEAKIKMLGVKRETIEKYGVVSEEVAKEMAKCVAEKAGSDIGVATTGIAGPDGGTKEQPVGTFYAAAYRDGKYEVQSSTFGGIRETIITRATNNAFELVRKLI